MLKGAKKFVLQQFKTEHSLVDDTYKDEKTYTHQELHDFKSILKEYISSVEIRD
jgi:hypothetical protein